MVAKRILRHPTLRTCTLLLLNLVLAGTIAAQDPAVPVRVDDEGVIRWTDSGEEVALFGTNYSAAFEGYAGEPYGFEIESAWLEGAR